MAQSVYSVNVVGYINVSCPPGNSAIANQLLSTNNTVKQLFVGVPEGAAIYTWNQSILGFDLNNYSTEFGSGWDNETQTLDPGQGIMFSNPNPTPYVVTFVGEVPQGTDLTVKLKGGVNIVSSKVPQAGKLVADLGYPVSDGDQVLKWNQSILGWDSFLYDITFGSGWDPSEPTFAVGEAVVISSAAAKDWTRNFTIN